MSHVDPTILALRALGESAGTTDDAGHLNTCAHCQAELEQLRAVVTAGRSGAEPVQMASPPPQVWAAIAAELGDEVAPGTELDQDGPRRPVLSGTRWWRRPLVAGVAGLLIGAGAVIGVVQLTAAPGPTVIATSRLRPLPQFPQWHGASATAVLQRNGVSTQVNITLRAQPATGFFEVWLLARDGVKMISLGDLNHDHDGLFTLPPEVNLAEYSRIDISLQPFDGSTLHSQVSVVRGSVP